MPVTVYGASDDLIEIEGDVTEEFNALEGLDEAGDKSDGGFLAFSNGIVLRVRYTDGIWRISPVKLNPEVGDVVIVQAIEGDSDDYTDRATVPGTVDWVVFGSRVEIRRA